MGHAGKLMEMLTGYAAAHQHPFNIFVHMIGIPTIMFGVLIPLSWVGWDAGGLSINLAHVAMLGFFLFYLTLDKPFALAFLVFAFVLVQLATWVGAAPLRTSGTIAAAAFLGGFAAQFVGHAVEKAMPVLVKHPIQAGLSAPFFVVVELFKIAGLRDDLFNEVQAQIERRRAQET
jgi:uncharacterized membrane protein YGL010W